MKTIVCIAAVLGCMFWDMVAAATTQAKELEVGLGKDYLMITAAMANAVSGDIIKVSPGEYGETIVFKRGVIVEGTDKQNVKILGSVTLASNVMLKDVMMEGRASDRIIISGDGVENVKLVGVSVIGGGYYSFTEQLISISNTRKILLYDCELIAMNANCLVIKNGCFYIVVMRTGFTGKSEYRREAKTPLIINNAGGAKIINNSFFKERSWHPAWRGNPIFSGINLNRAQLINNVFYAVVDNDPIQYGYNGLWMEGARLMTIKYNVFYQTGLYGIVPFNRQHHLAGSGIHISNVIEGDPTVNAATGPTVDTGSPLFPLDPDFTRADIGKEIFMQYDNLLDR